jgi:RimJ/RimL family protein N-acetyltransferase
MPITERVLLRQWTDDDRIPFAAINADPEVMAHYPAPLDRAGSDASLERLRAHVDQHGFGLWAAERRSDGRLLGFVGLQHVPFEAHFTPAVEIGWRLARDAWGHGYATEAAVACVDYAFADLGLDELLAMARPGNLASLRVMERIGMTHDPADDFRYSPRGAGEQDFVLYRLPRSASRGGSRPR